MNRHRHRVLRTEQGRAVAERVAEVGQDGPCGILALAEVQPCDAQVVPRRTPDHFELIRVSTVGGQLLKQGDGQLGALRRSTVVTDGVARGAEIQQGAGRRVADAGLKFVGFFEAFNCVQMVSQVTVHNSEVGEGRGLQLIEHGSIVDSLLTLQSLLDLLQCVLGIVEVARLAQMHRAGVGVEDFTPRVSCSLQHDAGSGGTTHGKYEYEACPQS